MTVRRPRVRADVQLLDGGGFRHYSATWQEAVGWLADLVDGGTGRNVRVVRLSITRTALLQAGSGQARAGRERRTGSRAA